MQVISAIFLIPKNIKSNHPVLLGYSINPSAIQIKQAVICTTGVIQNNYVKLIIFGLRTLATQNLTSKAGGYPAPPV